MQIQHLNLELEDYSKRLERAESEKNELMTLIEQFEKENLRLQDDSITLRDTLRKKEERIQGMRRENQKLRHFILDAARTGNIEMTDEINLSSEYGNEGFESSGEDSIEQKQQN